MITDIDLSGMNGVELATQVKADRPSLQVVFASGFVNRQMPIDKGLSSNEYVFIEKPFDLVTVEDTIHEVLKNNQ